MPHAARIVLLFVPVVVVPLTLTSPASALPDPARAYAVPGGSSVASRVPGLGPLDPSSESVVRVMAEAARRAEVPLSSVRMVSAERVMLDLGTFGCFPLPPGLAAPAVMAPAEHVLVSVSSERHRMGVVESATRVMDFREGRFCRESVRVSRGPVTVRPLLPSERLPPERVPFERLPSERLSPGMLPRPSVPLFPGVAGEGPRLWPLPLGWHPSCVSVRVFLRGCVRCRRARRWFRPTCRGG